MDATTAASPVLPPSFAPATEAFPMDRDTPPINGATTPLTALHSRMLLWGISDFLLTSCPTADKVAPPSSIIVRTVVRIPVPNRYATLPP